MVMKEKIVLFVRISFYLIMVPVIFTAMMKKNRMAVFLFLDVWKKSD